MIYFINDYSEGMHENILNAMVTTNNERHIGYGNDAHCLNAIQLIKDAIGVQEVDVHLLVGGTQTNRTAISTFLRPFEAVISTSLGHIAVHETGAIEASGHKVIEMYSKESKLTPSLIKQALENNVTEHMVKPKMVYISNTTEMGAIYTKKELEEISKICKENDLYLFLDGARLAVALTSDKNDLTLKDIASLCDAFYIGATKNGALFGEALVIVNPKLKPDFRYSIKQNGALLAKGRFLGIQFEELMKNDLYFKLGKHANDMAKILKDGLINLGYELIIDSETNLLFITLSNEKHEKLSKYCYYEVDGKVDENHIRARFVTSFKTTKQDISEFLEILKNI